jgi:hypothetical protein
MDGQYIQCLSSTDLVHDSYRAVHSCDGGNKDIGGSWIEFSIVLVKREVDYLKWKVA